MRIAHLRVLFGASLRCVDDPVQRNSLSNVHPHIASPLFFSLFLRSRSFGGAAYSRLCYTPFTVSFLLLFLCLTWTSLFK